MATGDKSDFLARIKATLPPWFTDVTPILDALLLGLSAAWANIYSLYLYAALQTRIKTATDGWLDLVAGDFFGTRIARKANQGDASFRAVIIANLFRERATRGALISVLTELTGRVPIVIEPQQPGDCGGYGIPTSGYGVAGYYGSQLLPSQCFLIAFRPASAGIPNIAGYGNPQAAYGTPSLGGMYGSLSLIIGQVADADIYAAIDSVKPVGTVIWTTLKS
ncbi:hypothetical protein J7E70_02300 [Variovorax paradoxus]|nr:hypothetical protein [Variovorax paradoxus]MBT2299285.1 hypothetical protein [Variovorax paradoxus]